ncbi:MAG: rhodanese-like domain-containing protein [Pseudobdellovibrio sp.]
MTYEFKNKTKNPHFEIVTDIDPQEVFANADQLTLIDVRENEEYNGELGHAAQTKLIVLNTLPDQIAKIPTTKPIVFICRSGGRSAQAAALAAQRGINNTYNMRGGMLLWNQLQLPTETN